MDVLTIVYLTYSFVSFYFLFFYLLIYIPHRKEFHSIPKPERVYSLSIVVPCYNEEDDIGGTIEALLKSDYKGLKKIIIVDDCSKDNSWKIIQDYAKKYEKVMGVQTPKNSGKASGAKNYGAKYAHTELIGFTDGDSYPEQNAISNMIGFFNNPKVGAVASSVFVKRRNTFLEKIQSIEYKMIAFARKLLGYVDAIYVTPGPLAVYRKDAFDKIGGFDEKNMTEDIEITWAFVKAGYKAEMSYESIVYSVAPDKIKPWLKQRIRWNIGGIQTISKYKQYFGSNRVGMLGKFILPYFIFNWVLGVCGFLILLYRLARTVFIKYLATTYSLQTQTALVTFRDINLTPSILFFFGVASIAMNFVIVSIALTRAKREDKYMGPGIPSILFYFFVYILFYPIILFTSIYKFFRGKYTW
ncbi:MAG: glycosyltransferase [Nanoarchaeota archaeon]